MSVSFCKKIPIAKCKIMDLKKGKFVPATFFEVDCSDKKDITEIESARGNWDYKNVIVCGMKDKYDDIKSGKKHSNNTAFYIMEKNNGEILGLTQANNSKKKTSIDFIESKNGKKYKYVGQTMIAALTKAMKHQHKNTLAVPFPMPDTYGFYIGKCGFKPYKGTSSLYMKKPEMKELQNKTESKTHSQIIDLKV